MMHEYTDEMEQEVENDDEIPQQMTASYSEISFKSNQSINNKNLPTLEESMHLPGLVQRPVTLTCEKSTLAPLNLGGSIRVEGNMTHFVAEDLEHKIKLSSPQMKKGDTPPTSGGSRSESLYRQLLLPQITQVDAKLLNDLECEAHKIATSIDNLTESLCGILHSISSITSDNIDAYKDAVTKLSDAMDSNIKSMYTTMTKMEEVTQAMKLVHAHAVRLKEIRRLVDLLDGFV